MERQKKPWEEMTEEERQAVRESWKHTLPEEYDVFCFGGMVREKSEGDLNIPGNLYVDGFLDVFGLVVAGTVIVNDYINAANITVQGGSCICGGDVIASNVSISNGDFISDGDIDVADITIQNGNFISDGNIDTYDITVQNGNCIVHHNINSWLVNVNGTLDCYDIESNGYKICATDFVCRCYKEKIQ